MGDKLLANTKFTEDVFKQIIGCYLAGNLSKVMQGLSDFHGQDIIGNAFVKTSINLLQRTCGREFSNPYEHKSLFGS